ncbi:MAG: TRAP transporter substrate-binding protein DctP [Treponemataceae bacterium]|nr:TRAP transporter substrate-binding protein DctP [Treponemataceae bacterium]
MKFKRLFVALMCLLAFTSIYAQKINLKIGSVAPDNSPWAIEQKKIAQEWAKSTNGVVNVNFMTATALGGEAGVIQKMRVARPGQKAPLDGGIFTNIGIYALAPETNILTLCVPFMFRDQEELSLVLKESQDEINAAIEEQGFVLLGWFNVGWAYFFTKEEVRTPTQLKNVSLSVGGITSPELGRAFQHAGYKTDDVSNEKILSSLKSNNGCGGLYTIPMYAYAAQYTKHATYVLGMPICPVMGGFVVNKNVWASIPENYKEVIMANIREAEKKFIEIQQENDNTYLAKIESEGGKIIQLTQAEKDVFQEDLYNDAVKMGESKETTVINYDFFKRIDSILQKHRGQ